MTGPARSRPPGRPARRGPLGAEARLSRLLVILPWLMERGEVPLDEVAATFSMSRDEVVRELEMASMCGLPPFVDELIDVFIDDETVFVGVPRLFTKPLRLTAPEGFALLTAGRAAMELPGADPDSPLGRGLAKLAAVLGEAPDSDPALVVDLAATELVDEFVDATKRVERLRIRYWAASRDEVSEREITPRRVFHERGDWYVSADDHRSGERRTFRIDRVESVDRTGVFDEPLDDAVADSASTASSVSWSLDGSLPRVTLRLQPAARWVVEQYPVDAIVERARGVVDATFAVTNERWLERLLLRVGTDAEVVEPAEYARLGVDAAKRVLARYT
jgi:proteasome accessory factor C